jgi:hypothetical protein
MNNEELKTYIKLKYFPVSHRYEYLIKLPDETINAMFTYIGKNPESVTRKDFKASFIKEYVVYNIFTSRAFEPAIEEIILVTLFKHYSENMHSIEE